MKASFLHLLHCIKCLGPLVLSPDFKSVVHGQDIQFGVLRCSSCKAIYPVLDGVGLFFRDHLLGHYVNPKEREALRQMSFPIQGGKGLSEIEHKQLLVAENWSYQWNEMYTYSPQDMHKQQRFFLSEELFFKFISINPEELRDTCVVVWCGGRGREAFHIAKYNPQVLIVNEIGDEIYAIRHLISPQDNVLLLRCDMTDNPLNQGVADFSICDHALQHVADHRLGFKKMLEALKAKGSVAVNVYSYENNFLMTHCVEPLKHILHRLPLRVQRYIAFIPAVCIYVLAHCFYVPIGRIVPSRICQRIPLFDHMIFWSKDTFNFVHTACFDLIHAPISYHFKKAEIVAMANENALRIKVLDNVHGTTWTFIGEK